MKKIIVLVLAIVMTLTLVACGHDVHKTTTTRWTADGVEEEVTYTIDGKVYSEEEYEALRELGFKG